MVTEKDHKPFLIQRIKLKSYGKGQGTGVYKHFSFDYMGSAEFEFGALPKAIKEFRASDASEEMVPKKLVVRGSDHKEHTLWYVGLPNMFEVVQEFVKGQLASKHSDHRLKERTNMWDCMIDDGPHSKHYKDFEGWWDIDCPWALFTMKDYAKLWLKGLRNK